MNVHFGLGFGQILIGYLIYVVISFVLAGLGAHVHLLAFTS